MAALDWLLSVLFEFCVSYILTGSEFGFVQNENCKPELNVGKSTISEQPCSDIHWISGRTVIIAKLNDKNDVQ